EPIKLTHRTKQLTTDGQYYAEEVRRFVVNKFGENSIYLGGLSIRTGLDPTLQNYAVEALQDGLIDHDKKHGWRGPVAHVDENGREELKKYAKEYAPKDWEYALVESVTDQEAKIFLTTETEGTIPFAEMKWAKKALERGRISIDEVKKVSDVLAVGDIILVSKKKGQTYTLQQIPLAEGALVAIDPHTGRVLAMQGGFAFERNQFNRAVQAYRQPGSSFKPFVYTAALDSGYTPSTLILDAPIVMQNLDGTKWKPENYSKQFYGPTTLRVGIEKSRNLMTVRLAQAIGIRKVLEYGKKFNISDHLERNLATALGASETTLLRLTTAYGMLVNGGKKITPIFIDRIQDRNGRTIYKHDERACEACVGPDASPSNEPILPDEREQIQDPASAYQMVNILTGVIQRGTGSAVRSLNRNLGAKSGTSNDNIDAWFIGFSPDLVVGVWVGKDNPEPLGPHDTGGVVAAPIFREFMKRALADKPDVPFRVPDSVKLVRVNATTGKPARAGDANVIMEAFRLDTDIAKPSKVVGQDMTLDPDDSSIPDLGGIY
ncbi:MAG: penicillin-binding protein, partial [Alphaproteobacteria bacterium]|nr:penicillin-binding protein [Alphaproteobacteria bacterium]